MSLEHPRVIIADDAVLMREGVRQLLAAGGCEVVGAARDVESMPALLDEQSDVDALVLDIRMPPGHRDEGMRALEELRAAGNPIGVLLLSMYASPTLAVRALSAGGATGYLLKERVTDGQALVAAVRTVVSGGTVETHVEHILDKLGIEPSRKNTGAYWPSSNCCARENESAGIAWNPAADNLNTAMARIRLLAYPILDGTLIPIDRVADVMTFAGEGYQGARGSVRTPCPRRATTIVQAILVLHHVESPRYAG